MTQPTVKAIPDGMHSITPYLTVDGADAAIDFYRKAFGAVELSRVASPQGKLVNAQLRFGNSMVMLMDAFPEMGALDPKALNGSPVTIHLQVEKVDEVFAQAVAAGATVTMPVADMFWGDRYGALRDPFGHHWSVATHTRDLTPQQIEEGMRQMGS